MGGRPLLGYDINRETKRLIVNEREAEQVRQIFGLYLEHEGLLPTVEAIHQRGWRTKSWTTKAGKAIGNILATGQVKDQAEVARVGRVTRARVTQILNLTSLAPDIQTAILNFAPTTMLRDQFKEREVRQIAAEPNWEKQRDLFQRLFAKQNATSGVCSTDQKTN